MYDKISSDGSWRQLGTIWKPVGLKTYRPEVILRWEKEGYII